MDAWYWASAPVARHLEHETFGLGPANRVDRLEEYLQILTALLKNEQITLDGKYYHITDGRLPMTRTARCRFGSRPADSACSV